MKGNLELPFLFSSDILKLKSLKQKSILKIQKMKKTVTPSEKFAKDAKAHKRGGIGLIIAGIGLIIWAVVENNENLAYCGIGLIIAGGIVNFHGHKMQPVADEFKKINL